ncbi:polysaccharide pyruvyl transferase family protein [Microbacterium sp. Au-Mic1]|uniref:polysaccharide pyruvyl transferase family protein n=1 Tax=Microbacterium sp. Au-Mic1 TaxID=2906457 RepID=UPI001E5F5ABC|nr:polysaccharide pyruvyl transferase family protein [Microbacterium sp. Au-Mic1]MCE4027300.1 polysaccharide pyruvyl transferase family protein [Microbacterium sp. Au-Mic1]
MPAVAAARRESRLRRGLYARARQALLSDAGLRLVHAVERMRVLAHPRRLPLRRGSDQREQDRDRDAVMLPAGGGNIGDQAMFEAYLANTPGDVVAVMRDADAYVIPEEDRARVRVLHAPLLSGGTLRGRWGEVCALADQLRAARSFAVIGADIMDGGYNRAEAVTRAEMLRLARRLGADARLLGFSWGQKVDSAASAALARAAREARLFVRDPISAERLDRAGIAAVEAADLVFAADGEREPADVSAWLAQLPDPVVIVNLSGLIERRTDLVPEFVALIDRLTAEGMRVVLLPHCLRDADDDLAVCRRAGEAAARADRVLLVERALRPAEVRWLTARADAVVTGRMHLSILALGQGTPVVVLRTRGKVEGLARMFGLEEYTLDPAPGIGDEAGTALADLFADTTLRERIGARLPHVRALAQRQFAPDERPSAAAV